MILHFPFRWSVPVLVLFAAAPGYAQCEYEQVQVLAPDDLQSSDAFGSAVALDGDTLLVGAPGDEPLGPGAQSGCGTGGAYVFERVAGQWVQTAVLTAADGAPQDCFGSSVAPDGDTALVGASGDELAAGAVYVFERGPAGWTQTAKLVAGDGAPSAFLGRSVSLSGDRAVAGAHGAEAAYVFERGPAGWAQTAKLTAGAGAPFEAFGAAVAVDGETVAVGAPAYDAPGDDDLFARGRVFLYSLTPAGWMQDAQFDGDHQGARLGTAVALHGELLLAGAPDTDLIVCQTPTGAGSATLYERAGGVWSPLQTLFPAESWYGDFNGISVSLDGTTAVVGAWRRGWSNPCAGGSTGVPARPGAAHVFELVGGLWQQTAVLSAEAAPANADTYPVAHDGSAGVIGSFSGSGLACVLEIPLAPQIACLEGTPGFLPAEDGGVHTWSLDAGADVAGLLYLLLGSAGGSAPGLSVQGVPIPLVAADPYFQFTLTNPNVPPLSQTLGTLDPAGQASASLNLPAGLSPTLAGLTLHHAYVVLDLAAGGAPVRSSFAEPLVLAPPLVLLAEDFEAGAPGWQIVNVQDGLWHVAADGECGSVSQRLAYQRGPSSCDYSNPDTSFGYVETPPFVLAGEPPFKLAFESELALDATGLDFAFVRLLESDGSPSLTVLEHTDLNGTGVSEDVTVVLPLTDFWKGQEVVLRFVFGAEAGGNDALGWRVDDVRVYSFAP